MLGAATTVVARLARPRGVAAAAFSARTSTSSSVSSLSNLFHSQCSLLSTGNKINNDASPTPAKMTSLLGSESLLPFHLRTTVAAKTVGRYEQLRWFASKGRKREGDQRPAFTSSEDADDNHNDGMAPPPLDDATISGSSQHDTWVQFQRSIAVSGADTGQTVRELKLGKKNRGGKMARKRKEKEAELEAKLKGLDTTQLKGGEFPALSYSEEETERLLAEAYAAIPPRAGKRGTLNLQRQKRRWLIKRMYDKRKKHERIATHERRMAERKAINAAIRQTVKKAPAVREREREYQDMVLERWAAMEGHAPVSKEAGMVTSIEG
eukprot:CAMPEP_0172552798 /NCGR_PEP_ID=MMETSP1067-20121228/47199_1 /TAXON_ID=265564 ORGANISM="Thalassiosira punctigera, Strain Tpunct2005C2" /NCGR_SAMPLE_ID=MMETSP1067 /ASSEMBLY_ACC=CAM_ASM_000444 /LENGTH=322 /DNA_ID=CAMNT_0013340855 /DNA_START=209 /DNA_END=1177 /DNA_ORIENTATION=-